MQTTVDLHDLVAAMGDAVVVSDADHVITLWNRAAERLFGYTEAEALGQSLDIIIPERLRARHREGYEKTMRTGVTRYGNELLQVPAIDKAGRPLSIAFTVALLYGAENKVTGIAAVIRDDTARFERDRAQRKRITALEKAIADAATLRTPAAPAGAQSGCPARSSE